MNSKITPFNQNFRMPAEWEKHEAVWIGWPHNKEDWPGKFMPIQWVYAEIVRKISIDEKVRILVESKEHENKANHFLISANADISNIEFFHFKTNRGWTRDSCPAFIINGKETAQVNFKFNGWAKYPDHKKDQKLTEFISNKLNIKKFIPKLNGKQVVLEGGSIDVNGTGTLITTEECLLNEKIQVRNPGFTRQNYEDIFKNYLGISNVLWLGNGIAGDDTHGHVDDICRFVNRNNLVLVQENNPSDANYKNLQENKERLEDFKLEDGTKVQPVFLPMPEPVIFQGQRLPASYANFYISNSCVIVPTFNDPNDKTALGILSELIPDRRIVGIHALDLVWGLGTLHCLTHEQPISHSSL